MPKAVKARSKKNKRLLPLGNKTICNETTEIDESKRCSQNRDLFLSKLKELYKNAPIQTSNSQENSLQKSAKKAQSSESRIKSLARDLNPNNIKWYEKSNNEKTCYRCQHFSKKPENLLQTTHERTTCTGDSAEEENIALLQSIVWLKSEIACMKDIPGQDFHSVFHEQWNRLESNKNRTKTRSNSNEAACSEQNPVRVLFHARNVDEELNDSRDIIQNNSAEQSGRLPWSPERYNNGDYSNKKNFSNKIIPESESDSNELLSPDLFQDSPIEDHRAESFIFGEPLDELLLTPKNFDSINAASSIEDNISENILQATASFHGLDLTPIRNIHPEEICEDKNVSQNEHDESCFMSFNRTFSTFCDQDSMRLRDEIFDTISINSNVKKLLNNNKEQEFKDVSFEKSFDSFYSKTKSCEFRDSNKLAIREQKKLSSRLLNYFLDDTNVDDVALQSMRVSLSFVSRVNQDYKSRWDDSLEMEAVNVILNFCDLFEAEKKTNACTKEILGTVKRTLEEIIGSTEMNKVPLWMYRISIVLELCNSSHVCIETINYLIAKLKLYQTDIISQVNEKEPGTYFISLIQQRLSILLYSLNILLEKYQLIFPDEEDQSMDSVVPSVTDQWKKQLNFQGIIKEETKQEREERWLKTLNDFTMISMEDFFHFANKSRKLCQLLSQLIKNVSNGLK